MAPITDATPAAGQAKSKSRMRVINDYKEFNDSPAHATAKNRIKNIRQRLDDLIGLKVGAISNAVTAPWALHAIHIVTRTLKKENELVVRAALPPTVFDLLTHITMQHECFRKAVGARPLGTSTLSDCALSIVHCFLKYRNRSARAARRQDADGQQRLV